MEQSGLISIVVGAGAACPVYILELPKKTSNLIPDPISICSIIKA